MTAELKENVTEKRKLHLKYEKLKDASGAVLCL